jgi:hypothetical protein
LGPTFGSPEEFGGVSFILPHKFLFLTM